jgi:hypothetical protein
MRERVEQELLFSVGEKKEITVGRPKGINTLRRAAVMIRFEVWNLREKDRNLRDLERKSEAVDYISYGRNFWEKHQNL